VGIERLRKGDDTPWRVAFLTATPGQSAQRPFGLSDDDRDHPLLSQRLKASKPARLVEIPGKQGTEREIGRVEAITQEVSLGLDALKKSGIPTPAIGVVVNRVARARSVFERLRRELSDANVILIIGPARPIEREHKAVQQLSPLRPGVDRAMQQPLIVVATRTIEAGVDIDLDGLVTEAAALDALRQRFGRVNRAGRSISPISTITVHKADIGAKANDPVYGDRIVKTWAALLTAAGPTKGTIDFGIDAFPHHLITGADNLASPKPNAPVLLPAYADLWSHTSPVPNADPEIALFLHGPDRSPASIQIVWRADIAEVDLALANRERLIELCKLVPPRAAEAIEVPIWAARAWLGRRHEALAYLSDATEVAPELDDRQQTRRVFRYAGADDPRTGSVNAGELRPGDLIIVPADYGGCDEWGWSPENDEPVYDVAEAASWAYRAAWLCA
jgi:CRISPR-associated endonuclease/helicase Cas3